MTDFDSDKFFRDAADKRHEVFCLRLATIHEANCLLGVIRTGELLSEAQISRGAFHLHGLTQEFPKLSRSQMACKLAERLQYRPKRGFWSRLRWLLWAAEEGPCSSN